MTAYFDESGTHGAESPATIVAGFGATAAQWVGFEKRLAKLYSDFGVNLFHAKDLRGTKNDFDGWSRETKGHFNSRFLRIIDEQLSFGAAGVLARDDYRKHYRSKPWPPKARPDTEYGMCFRMALKRAILFVHEQGHNQPLNAVLELGHKNSADAIRVFEQAKKRWPDKVGTISFATKSECQFLGSADSFAYAMFRNAAGYTKHPDNPARVPVGPCIPPYYVHKIGMSQMHIDKKGLTNFYRQHSKL